MEGRGPRRGGFPGARGSRGKKKEVTMLNTMCIYVVFLVLAYMLSKYAEKRDKFRERASDRLRKELSFGTTTRAEAILVADSWILTRRQVREAEEFIRTAVDRDQRRRSSGGLFAVDEPPIGGVP